MRKLFSMIFTINTSGTIVKSEYGGGFPEASAPYVYEGGRVFGIPSETFFLEVSYRLPSFVKWSSKGGNVSLCYTWRGSAINTDYYSYHKTRAETGKSPSITYKEFDGYYTINSRADYSLLDNLSLFVDIINLLNNQGYCRRLPPFRPQNQLRV